MHRWHQSWSRKGLIGSVLLAGFLAAGDGWAQPVPEQPVLQEPTGPLGIDLFIRPFLDQPEEAEQTLEILEANWDHSYVVMLLELSQFVTPELRGQIFDLLEEMTGEDLGPDRVIAFRNAPGYAWVWKNNPGRHPDYANFKAFLYARVNPNATAFFGKGRPASIFLDEVRWTTTAARNDLPALRDLSLMNGALANHLPATAPVFGVVNGGMARAYPKAQVIGRALVKDNLGGEDILGVFAPIDGTTVFYRTDQKGAHHELEDSGFFYRANKLLYDATTKSLWSSLAGSPVVGPLSGRGLELDRVPFVATTWGEWRRRHPQTTVLAPPTPEPGAARIASPRDLSAGEQLLFPIPKLDPRLKIKAEVLGLRWTNAPNQRLALSSELLRRQRLYQGSLGNVRFLVLTDRSGAHRVYESADRVFTQWNGEQMVKERDGKTWTLSEDDLRREGQVLRRLPAQNAYWYAWAAGYPDTGLVK